MKQKGEKHGEKGLEDRGERMGSAAQQFLGRVWNPHEEKV